MIRLAFPNDIDQIIEIYNKDRTFQHYDGILDYNRDNFLYYLAKKSSGKIFVLEDNINNNIINGFTLLFDMGMWAYIDVFIIRKSERGKNLGTKLMQYIEKMAHIKQWKMLELAYNKEDKSLKPFNDKLGFKGDKSMVWAYKNPLTN